MKSLLTMGALFMVLIANAQSYTFMQNIGTGEFDGPTKLDIGPDGHLYIIDEGNDRIVKMSTSGEVLDSWGEFGFSDGEFDDPNGIDVDQNGNVYVADRGKNEVQKFDAAGNHLLTIETSGQPDGDFSTPNDVALDTEGNIFVLEDGNLRVQKLDNDGNYITDWAVTGTEGSFLYTMTTIAIDAHDNVYVIDGQEIKKYDNDGNFLNSWGSGGAEPGQFSAYLSGMDFDNAGNVYICDSYAYEVEVFGSEGNHIGVFGSEGSGDGEFNFPNGIAISDNGAFYVSDFQNDRIVVYNVLTGLSESAHEDRKGLAVVNPAGNELMFTADYPGKASICTTTGEVVTTFDAQKGQNNKSLGQLSSGLYLIRLYGNEGMTSSRFYKK